MMHVHVFKFKRYRWRGGKLVAVYKCTYRGCGKTVEGDPHQ